LYSRNTSIGGVLVTGATGLVGRNLVSSTPSFHWRAALRRSAPRQSGVESILVGNIDGNTDWSQALIGIDSVVHLAARVHVMQASPGDRQLFEAVNVAGTERLAACAAEAGVKRFVFLSTVKVNGETSGARAFRADDVPNPSDDYSRSKFQAEQALARIARTSGMQTVSIRSPLVYGPAVRANFLRLLSWVDRGLPLPFESINNSRSMVSVWNLCDLIRTVLLHSGRIGGALMVSDGEDVSTPALIRLMAGALHRPARLFPVPPALLSAVGRLAGASQEISRLCSSLEVEITETRDQLDWSPPLTLESGIYQTADWYLGKLGRNRA
jgi:nucleoside-diphosphate-sugar epimerase